MIELRFATVEPTARGAITHFRDGTSYGAHDHDTHHYAVISHRCGYGDDTARFALEHEVAHLIAEEWFHNRPSRILWGLAHGKPLRPSEAVYEEAAAQMLQRWVRANERPIIGPNVDWDAVKAYALKKLI